ncbi:ABC transporter substrate-binding protein [Solimicrobium silvestre]|uniref:ABC-type sugar transport system periplasmic component n=1 Tax=Solimicrobium silvestre TaxID=2099400 RepID=A0A2S9H3E3_9BURK|nr:extracellular solute-binding protein [Solimicrobium silvestre]PRC94505.1 ABC-type sugar transport system periplasmic component [Solimicrobium silvestre]
MKFSWLAASVKLVLAICLVSFSFILVPSALAAPTQKIELWTLSMKPKFIPYFQQIVQKFEAQHPGIEVEWVDFPWDILQLKLITAIAAGTPPSLVNLNVPWAEEYARDSLIVPVDSMMLNKAMYTKAALEDLTFNGHIYGFPHYSNVNVIAYNSAIFAEAGLKQAPKSLAEELAFAKQIYAKTGKAGYAPTLGKIDGFFLQQGLDVVKNGRAVFNSPQHVALIKKLADAYQAGGILKDQLFSEDSFPSAIDAYKGGRLGMLVSAPTALKRIELDAKDIYAVTKVAPAPLGPTNNADGGWMFHYAVPKGVNPKLYPAIATFAEFLTNDENQLAFAKLAGVMPTTVQALANPYFMQTPAHASAAEQALPIAAASMKFSRSLYVAGLDDYDEMRRVMVKAVEAGMTGKQDIQQALDEAVRIWNKKLQQQAH